MNANMVGVALPIRPEQARGGFLLKPDQGGGPGFGVDAGSQSTDHDGSTTAEPAGRSLTLGDHHQRQHQQDGGDGTAECHPVLDRLHLERDQGQRQPDHRGDEPGEVEDQSVHHQSRSATSGLDTVRPEHRQPQHGIGRWRRECLDQRARKRSRESMRQFQFRHKNDQRRGVDRLPNRDNQCHDDNFPPGQPRQRIADLLPVDLTQMPEWPSTRRPAPAEFCRS